MGDVNNDGWAILEHSAVMKYNIRNEIRYLEQNLSSTYLLVEAITGYYVFLYVFFKYFALH